MTSIDKDIPIPNRSPVTAILKDMAVGDSVKVPTTTVSGWRSVAGQLGIKITARTLDEKESRIWRTK